jgi:hypothetical protein
MALRINPQLERLVIQFQVQADQPWTLDELTFIYFVQDKFNAEIESASSFRCDVNGRNCKFLHIELIFPNLNQFDNAYDHCLTYLTRDGTIEPEFRVALNHVDPARLHAEELLDLAQEAQEEE